jgi:hypothetical protein
MRLILAALLLLTLPSRALPYLDDYSPFTKRKPKLFPLSELNVLEEKDGFVTLGTVRNGRGVSFLKLSEESKDNNEIFIYDASGSLLKRDGFPNDCFLRSALAYIADMNGDSVNDFAVIIKTAATGLGEYEYYVLFALSSGNGYEVSVLKSWDVDRKDFIDVKRDGHCQFIYTSLIYPDEKRGIKHTYWAYNLLEADGARLRPANNLSPMFPKWVWYTKKPNHKRSRLVTRLMASEWLNSDQRIQP